MKKRQFRGAAVAAAPFLIGSAAHAQWSSAYTSPRNAVVNAAGARIVQVEAAAGSLRVEGKQGLSQGQITGTARASSQGVLSQIRLIAERQGDRVFIKADMQNDNGRNAGGFNAALDLVLEVPEGMEPGRG